MGRRSNPAVGTDRPEPTAVNVGGTFIGADYTADEVEFLRTVERFQKRQKRKFLSHVDYLRIAMELGYTRARGGHHEHN